MLSDRFKGKDSGEATRKSILNGVLPEGLSLVKALADLKRTQAPNQVEMFGFLSLKQYRHTTWLGKKFSTILAFFGYHGQLLKDHGLISCKLVTQAFTQYIVDSLQDSTTYPMDVFKYHAYGTGTTNETNGDTELETEVEDREAGTQIEGATANIFKTVATTTFTATRTITEHGIFSASAIGTMMDRSEGFTPIPVENLDTVTATYQLTVIAET